jgi:hypothetical protein
MEQEKKSSPVSLRVIQVEDIANAPVDKLWLTDRHLLAQWTQHCIAPYDYLPFTQHVHMPYRLNIFMSPSCESLPNETDKYSTLIRIHYWYHV